MKRIVRIKCGRRRSRGSPLARSNSNDTAFRRSVLVSRGHVNLRGTPSSYMCYRRRSGFKVLAGAMPRAYFRTRNLGSTCIAGVQLLLAIISPRGLPQT
jgi:hypothetical protein